MDRIISSQDETGITPRLTDLFRTVNSNFREFQDYLAEPAAIGWTYTSLTRRAVLTGSVTGTDSSSQPVTSQTDRGVGGHRSVRRVGGISITPPGTSPSTFEFKISATPPNTHWSAGEFFIAPESKDTPVSKRGCEFIDKWNGHSEALPLISFKRVN